jgi:multidrug efflux pump
MLINLAPFGHRTSSPAKILDRLGQEARRVPGANIYLQPVQDLTIDSSSGKTQYQFALQGADTATVTDWSNRLVQALGNEPKMRNVSSDLQNEGLAAYIDINRDTAARLGITPATVDDTLYFDFGQRIISTIFTQ